jgi:hypothetical protein
MFTEGASPTGSAGITFLRKTERPSLALRAASGELLTEAESCRRFGIVSVEERKTVIVPKGLMVQFWTQTETLSQVHRHPHI